VEPAAARAPITTPDGVVLAADLAMAASPRAGAVLLHPHPRLGGNRFNNVVDALFRALPPHGISALRFDFRPGSGGERSTLTDERVDAFAAVDAIAAMSPDRGVFVVGYSFGAAVALGVTHPALVARVVIAPPLALIDVGTPVPLPTLVLVPEHDDFSPPEAVAPIIADWPNTLMEVIDSTDHFMAGCAGAVADVAAAWLAAR
jgi:hypothetical protein